MISTHTLTWSVTIISISRCVNAINFNSHAHVERDFGAYFNNSAIFHFNSHAHVERDLTVPNVKGDRLISTHTLTWSVTAISNGSEPL